MRNVRRGLLAAALVVTAGAASARNLSAAEYRGEFCAVGAYCDHGAAVDRAPVRRLLAVRPVKRVLAARPVRRVLDARPVRRLFDRAPVRNFLFRRCY